MGDVAGVEVCPDADHLTLDPVPAAPPDRGLEVQETVLGILILGIIHKGYTYAKMGEGAGSKAVLS